MRPGDAEALVRVENAAAELFRDHGFPEIADDPIPDAAWLMQSVAGQSVQVAADARDRPVGFAVAGPLDRWWHLKELSVDPAHGRRGLGRALVEAFVAAGRAAGFAEASLTTFRNLPFNRPFYESAGFSVLAPDDAPHALRARFAAEVPAGVAPETRIIMVRRL